MVKADGDEVTANRDYIKYFFKDGTTNDVCRLYKNGTDETIQHITSGCQLILVYISDYKTR